MPHQIITRRRDGTESRTILTLTTPDLMSQIVTELNATSTAEVTIRSITVDEVRNLEGLREILERLQSPEALANVAQVLAEALAASYRRNAVPGEERKST